MDVIGGFDWDEGNREKCAKHGVTIEEIERIFDDSPSPRPTLHTQGWRYEPALLVAPRQDDTYSWFTRSVNATGNS